MQPKKPVHATPWVYWQEETKLDFHTHVAPRSLTRIQPNLLQRCPPGRWVCILNIMQIAPSILRYKRPKFRLNFFAFFSSYSSSLRTLRKIAIKCECILGSSWNLVHKTGTLKRISVPTLVQIRLRFSELWLIVHVICCHAYKVNCLEEWVETWHVDGVDIVGVPFVVWKESRKRPWRYDIKSNRCQNYAIKVVNKKSTQLYRNRSE